VPRRTRARAGPPVVTLSSDLGAVYAAQMKAVLAHRVSLARVVDLAHDLRPHDIGEAAFVVRAMAERFPSGSIHVVVVDPGVGGTRAPVAVACRDGSQLVGPDNGVLAPLADALGGGTAYRLDPARVRAGRRVGTTFDGRDLFAPAAARLATGSVPADLGPPVPLSRLGGAAPRRTRQGAHGHVVHVDRFANLVSDVPTSWVPRGTRSVRVHLGRRVLQLPLVRSYEEGGRGRPVVLGSSFGTLEVAVGEGRAAERLGAGVGSSVGVAWTRLGERSVRRNRKYRPT
jgi:S-adenosyl-L-methionine hydrolase (adenosine-forming)